MSGTMYNALRDLNLWLPGDSKPQSATAENTLKTFTTIFDWEGGRAGTHEGQQERIKEICNLLDNLRYSAVPNDRMYLEKRYYSNNKKIAFTFFREMQSLVEAKGWVWKMVCTTRGHKGFWWGPKATPQQEGDAQD